MLNSDAQIGTNLQRLRGDMTQTALARAMSERGHRWSQPTVVAVEKGERPLRLSEAVDLVQILQVDQLDDLGPGAAAKAMMTAWVRLGRAEDALIEAGQAYNDARLAFGLAAIEAAESERAFAGNGQGVVARSPEEALQRGRSRQLLSEPEDLQEVLDRLAEIDGVD